MGTLSNNSKVGDKGKDLILQTSGRVYVQVKDRFYEINFRGDDEEDKDEEKEETPQVIFVDNEDSLTDLQYPGDNYLILTKDGKLFITENEGYTPVIIQTNQSSIFSTPITIATQEPPLIITSSQLVKNFNAEYLNGISSERFPKKDTAENITGNWAFNEIFCNLIKDSKNINSLDFIKGVLTIDTINANHINNADDNEGNLEDNTSNSEFDILSKPTYFSNGLKIISAKKISKVDEYFNTDNNQWESFNENSEVGGFSIAELIKSAYDNEYLNTDFSLFYYFSTLTTAEKYDETSNTWILHDLIEDDFVSGSSEPSYMSMRFLPKNRAVFVEVPYGVRDTCATKIYDRWYNISNYTSDIKAKYGGVTFECVVESNLLNSGTELNGESSRGKLEGLLVGGTETVVRIIVSGTDCEFLYMKSSSDTLEQDIEICEEENFAEKGKTISADLSSGNVLFTENSSNIIGNISGTENSIFGTLEGYGLTSEGNCYFVNPGIALVNTDNLNYLKLYNKEQSFIGINKKNEKWITIETDGGCDMRRDKMYNINNHLSFCSFGPIRVEEDGSATIGSGETQITITADGKVQIPEACIIK